MKIVFENLIASVRIMTGALAFMIYIVVAALMEADPAVILFGGIIVYAWFFILGAAIANMLKQINGEVTLEPIDEEAEAKEKEKAKNPSEHLGQLLDSYQKAEIPSFE